MFADVTAVNKTEPNKGTSIIKTEGESVMLNCSYDSDGENVRLYWYRQYPNGEPQYLLREGARSNKAQRSVVDPRFTVSITKREQNHVDLKISSAAVSDSALYYCALVREGARSNSAKHSSDPRFQSSTSRMLTELIISSVTVQARKKKTIPSK
uniref:T-cell receptor alpha/delta variable 40.0 n=1 Tax=Sinocyclocheilus anshuiensis TaxID=1608454 RepID=A0A671STE2_9TELE